MMLQQLLESKGPVKCEFLCSFGSEDTTFPCRRWDNHVSECALLSIFHMVSILKICYNYRKFIAEVCSLWLLEG